MEDTDQNVTFQCAELGTHLFDVLERLTNGKL